MTLTTPLRLMILQLRQIFLTDANTFMIHIPCSQVQVDLKAYGPRSTAQIKPFLTTNQPCSNDEHRYFARNTILAFDRS